MNVVKKMKAIASIMIVATVVLSITTLTSCSKDDNTEVKSETEILLVNGKWNRTSMEVNPSVLLPKQDGSGDFFTVSNLMEIENLEGYDKNYEGFYTFKDDGTYIFTPNDEPNNSSEGTITLNGNIINAVNSQGESLQYEILELTNYNLSMELSTILFGQQTTVKIVCDKL